MGRHKVNAEAQGADNGFNDTSLDDAGALLGLPPHVILPCQWAPERRSDVFIQGEEGLLLAFFKGNIADLLGFRKSLGAGSHPRRIAKLGTDNNLSARAWFDDPDSGALSLNLVCEVFGWEAQRWREWARFIILCQLFGWDTSAWPAWQSISKANNGKLSECNGSGPNKPWHLRKKQGVSTTAPLPPPQPPDAPARGASEALPGASL